jgi:CRISPR/Cas system-associated exonuclease Cas4 (RecB family)
MPKVLFNSNSKEPFKISRTKIELFIECPRCFYLDLRKGVGRPRGFPFTLNAAVDFLLKKEFDIHRARETRHPLMKNYGIDAVPLKNENMDQWRNNFQGIRHHHKVTNFLVFGAIDDVWVNPKGEFIIVDYKATSTTQEINLDDGREYHEGYKRQMEIYQWLFRQNGFNVSDTGYFVYVNATKDKEAFDKKLEFEVRMIPYKGNDNWVEGKIIEARKCLEGGVLPKAAWNCEYCAYRQRAVEAGA